MCLEKGVCFTCNLQETFVNSIVQFELAVCTRSCRPVHKGNWSYQRLSNNAGAYVCHLSAMRERLSVIKTTTPFLINVLFIKYVARQLTSNQNLWSVIV